MGSGLLLTLFTKACLKPSIPILPADPIGHREERYRHTPPCQPPGRFGCGRLGWPFAKYLQYAQTHHYIQALDKGLHWVEINRTCSTLYDISAAPVHFNHWRVSELKKPQFCHAFLLATVYQLRCVLYVCYNKESLPAYLFAIILIMCTELSIFSLHSEHTLVLEWMCSHVHVQDLKNKCTLKHICFWSVEYKVTGHFLLLRSCILTRLCVNILH